MSCPQFRDHHRHVTAGKLVDAADEKQDRPRLFRKPGDLTRSIEQIAPEELAAGMREILKQNLTADKDGLYRTLAAQCGVTRMGATVTETLDWALYLLKDSIVIEGDYISLR